MPQAPQKENFRNNLEWLREIVHILRSPQGCPWDKEQTHDSLISNLVEESSEVIEAIQAQDDLHMEEEFGDLLLQVFMHCAIAEEQQRFDIEKVAENIAQKMIRRHPHVFASVNAQNSQEALQYWHKAKQKEQTDKQKNDEKPSSTHDYFQNAKRSLSGLEESENIQKIAAEQNFDWDNPEGVIEKIREELDEVEAELKNKKAGNKDNLEEEIGDLLFVVANLARFCGYKSENALRLTNFKIKKRFNQMAKILETENTKLAKIAIENKETAWQEAKKIDWYK